MEWFWGGLIELSGTEISLGLECQSGVQLWDGVLVCSDREQFEGG